MSSRNLDHNHDYKEEDQYNYRSFDDEEDDEDDQNTGGSALVFTTSSSGRHRRGRASPPVGMRRRDLETDLTEEGSIINIPRRPKPKRGASSLETETDDAVRSTSPML